MKTLKMYLVGFAAIAMVASGAVLAYAQAEPAKVKAQVEKKAGQEVTLFYGGSGNTEEQFPVGEMMGVYIRNRAFGFNENHRVGQVRIVGYGGEHFVKAELCEGRIRPGDVVKLKPGAGPAGMCVPPMK